MQVATSGARSSRRASAAFASSPSTGTPTRRASASPMSPRSSTSRTSTPSKPPRAPHDVDGVLTVSADRAVPVVAEVASRLGLPTIGADVARRMTHKIAMRRTLAEEGIPQPPFAAVRGLAEGRAAIETVGLPAVLKPVDSGGQRGVFRIDTPGDLESHLHAALAESPGQEAILEGFVDGAEMNGIVVARGRQADARDAVGSAAPARDRIRRRVDPPLSGLDPFGPARAGRAGRGARPWRRSACGTASRSRS